MQKSIVLLFILLSIISCQDEINIITSKQPGKIVGTVLPKMAIATVQLIQGNIIATDTTVNGVFTFNDIQPGIYRLLIKADNFGKQEIENVRVEDGEGNDIGIIQLYKYPYPLISTRPYNGEKNVSVSSYSSIIKLQFSNEIDPSSLERSFSIEPKAQIKGFNIYDNNNFVFYTKFNFNTEYKVTLDTNIITNYGEYLEFPAIFSFTTENFRIKSIEYPRFRYRANDPLSLVFNGVLSEDFHKNIIVKPEIQFNLEQHNFNYSNNSSISILPTMGWMANTTFNITLLNSLAEENGATLEKDTIITFTTPELKIVDTAPYNGQSYIDTNSDIRIAMNYFLDEGTIKDAITITPNIDYQILTYSRFGRTEFYLQATELTSNTKYTVLIDSSLTDYYGIPLKENYNFSFTTK